MRSFLKTLPWQENTSKTFAVCWRIDGSCGAKNIQLLASCHCAEVEEEFQLTYESSSPTSS